MTKKHVRNVAIFIIIVFAVTVVVYPLIFSPQESKPDGLPPVELEIKK